MADLQRTRVREREPGTGDLILLPIKPGGCEHRPFNRHADQSCKWIAFIYNPLHDEVASYIEHASRLLSSAPERRAGQA
jgi:hypothetical protein